MKYLGIRFLKKFSLDKLDAKKADYVVDYIRYSGNEHLKLYFDNYKKFALIWSVSRKSVHIEIFEVNDETETKIQISHDVYTIDGKSIYHSEKKSK